VLRFTWEWALASDSFTNSVQLHLIDVLDMSSANVFNLNNGFTNTSNTPLSTSVQYQQLLIDGDANDTVTASDGWTHVGDVSSSLSGSLQSYAVYNSTHGLGQLLIDQDINHAAVI
jgi:hypothetical protein